MVSDRMIAIKLLVHGIIILVISVYGPQCSLDDYHRDDFYGSLVHFVRKLGKKEIVVIDFNGHVGSNPENHEEQHKNYG